MPHFEKITSIKRVPTRTTVHNFYVPGHESYLANGIVTHNCYVARRKGYANPISIFVNIEEIMATIARHAERQGPKPAPTAADPALWVYELGTNSDGGVDATISDNIRDLIALFRTLPHAKATFSTKYVNRGLLDYDPQRKTRLRISLMPAATARIVDVRTAPIAERIAAINDFHAAGYEVNVNFAPVIWYEGWLDDYAELFAQLDDALAPEVKAQLAAEVIFLTHNQELHEVNERWHPHAEEWLWHPEVQEEKISGGGGRNVRYRLDLKRPLVADFRALLARKLPYCRVRYAF
jgi:spore photoproduct lyase